MNRIERFHSRGQQLCKFIEIKESFYIRKGSTRTGLQYNTIQYIILYLTKVT